MAAKVYFDETATKDQASAERVFSTPALERGREYFYVVRVEVDREGQKVSETKRITVRAGEDSRVSFKDMERAEGVAKVSSAQ